MPCVGTNPELFKMLNMYYYNDTYNDRKTCRYFKCTWCTYYVLLLGYRWCSIGTCGKQMWPGGWKGGRKGSGTSIFISIYPFINPSIYPPTYSFIYPPIYPFNYPPIYPFIYHFIYQSSYLTMNQNVNNLQTLSIEMHFLIFDFW